MAQRIWKRVGDRKELNGYGNGFHAVIYETKPLPGFDLEPIWTVLVHKNSKQVAKHITNSEAAVKRWAEANYLKSTREAK